MVFEHVDVQWTVISSSSIQETLRLMQRNASEMGWLVSKLIARDFEDVILGADKQWPAETLGSATYSKDGHSKHSLFWSTYTRCGLSKFTGGLYVNEYAKSGTGLFWACNQAFDDIFKLFQGEGVQCVVMVLEDDDGIDVGPGIVGYYRPSLWRRMASSVLNGVTIRSISSNWIEVRPSQSLRDGPMSVFTMPGGTRSSVLEIQAELEAEMWGT